MITVPSVNRYPIKAPSGGWFTRFFSDCASETIEPASTNRITAKDNFRDKAGHLSSVQPRATSQQATILALGTTAGNANLQLFQLLRWRSAPEERRETP